MAFKWKSSTRRTHKNGWSDADPGEKGELKKKNLCTVNLWNAERIFYFYPSFSFCSSLVDKCWKKGIYKKAFNLSTTLRRWQNCEKSMGKFCLRPETEE